MILKALPSIESVCHERGEQLESEKVKTTGDSCIELINTSMSLETIIINRKEKRKTKLSVNRFVHLQECVDIHV